MGCVASIGMRRLGVALLLAGLVILHAGCSGPGGRRYPVIGFGWVTVPTNRPAGEGLIDVQGAVVSGVVVGTAGPWTGLVIGRAETLTVGAATNAAAWAEGTLSGDGFRFRVVPVPVLRSLNDESVKTHEEPSP